MSQIRPSVFAISFMLVLLFSCKPEKEPRVLNLPKTDLSTADLIPKPVSLKATYSAFPLDQFTAIRTTPDSLGFPEVGEFLAEKIKQITQLQVPVNTEFPKQESVVYIKQSDSLSKLNKESYALRINKDSIILNAASAEAAFRGVQTLRQLLPL